MGKKKTRDFRYNTGDTKVPWAAASAALFCLFAACTAAAADLAFLKELVEIPSSSVDYPQVNRATRAMKAYLEKRGLFCTVETDEQGREILFAATKPGKEQDYIISAHLDVVPASYEGQYALKNDNGRLTGRGVGDDKGGSLAVAQALSALAGKDVSVGCIFGADEELGGFTTTWMVEKMGYRPRRMVIVVDSSYGKIGYATKGQLMVRATLTGKGGHSSAPWRCEDLITELSAAVVKIKEEWYRRHPMATGPDHWSDVLTPTVIHSEGTALNRIPSEVWVNFNLRSVRPEAKDECIQLVREMTKGKVEVVRYSPPCVSDGNDPYVLRLKKAMEAEIKAPVPLERMPFATDARCFVSCKVPVVNVGHAHGDSHGAAEWATASSIDLVTRYLTAFFLSEYRQGVATGASWAKVAEAGSSATSKAAFTSGVVRGDPAAPVSVSTNAAGHAVFDFGQHAFGWVEVDVARPGAYELVWGELLDSSGSVQTGELYTRRQGRIRCARTKGEFKGTGWTRIPYVAGDGSAFSQGDAGKFGKVMPFRWLEVVEAPFPVGPGSVRQVPIYYPYDMSESSFSCDSAALERVYRFCKHSIRATSFMGMFVDGDRERLPYEGDSFITQLGTYAATSDDTLVRRTIDHLSVHTTWPTEWKQFFIRMVYEDWMHSGKTDLVRKYYAMMKDVKSWRNLRRADGLLVTPGAKMTPSPDGGMFCDIVDWAKCYRDGFVFTPVNVVVNALHYRNLKELEAMARAIGEGGDAAKFADEAAQTLAAFQGAFFDSSAGRYRDGEGTDHVTVQGNAMALSCGVVPKAQAGRVADYVASKGFSCSTYMAHFVLDALFAAGREDEAIRLMSSGGHRSWLGMMEKGATIAMEFWDLTLEEGGRVPDMNHSWSTSPLNMVGRWVLGVNPLKPGFEEISISPRPGPLGRLSGAVPTPHGPVRLKMAHDGGRWNVEVDTPRAAEFSFEGKTVRLGAGCHAF